MTEEDELIPDRRGVVRGVCKVGKGKLTKKTAGKNYHYKRGKKI